MSTLAIHSGTGEDGHATTSDPKLVINDVQASVDDTPSNYIPGLFTLGATYNVLNGKYADPVSVLQQEIDWDKSETRIQEYGGKTYSIPKPVNYISNTTSDYRSYFGKTVADYTQSLSVHAGFDASYPGFSASASADYSESQRENLSNTFTRITYLVTEYILSLPPPSHVPELLKQGFKDDLDNMDPVTLYKQYGTHLLSSLIIGGRASFLTTTDSRTYSSEISIEAAAKISASYLVASGDMKLSAAEKEAMESFHESSDTTVVTRGGDPRYGNEQFRENTAEWAASVIDYPEFVDFGSPPCSIGLWELAATQARREELETAYQQFVQDYKADLGSSGPYLNARLTTDFESKASLVSSGSSIMSLKEVSLQFPPGRSKEWYMISPGASAVPLIQGEEVKTYPAVIASELVPGALAPVKWEIACTYFNDSPDGIIYWRAVPPTSDYMALGSIGGAGSVIDIAIAAAGGQLNPPEPLASRFRAVHKIALKSASTGITDIYTSVADDKCKIFGVDGRYWYADRVPLDKRDCVILDPAQVNEQFDTLK